MIKREVIDKEYSELENILKNWGKGAGKLAVVKAPPGSGKTHTLLTVISHWVENEKMRIAIGTQTNAQALDVANRFAKDHPTIPVTLWLKSSGSDPTGVHPRVRIVRKPDEVPDHPCVVIATVSKYGYATTHNPFDVLAIDESWQMPWEAFMATAPVSKRFMMIGDPGQIPPVVRVEPKRWETASRAPHLPAPQVVANDPDLSAQTLWGALPACRRLPFESVEWIKGFYDFDFQPYAPKGVRGLRIGTKKLFDPAIVSLLSEASPIGVQIPTPEYGPPLELDKVLAETILDFTNNLLESKSEICDNDKGEWRAIKASDVGISATHRILNAEILRGLKSEYRRDGLRVETPERWQGLQRAVMLIAHPLSGVVKPSGFDLDPGRLCVMASRHQSALFVFSRDHITETLEKYIPAAEQSLGKPDHVGSGLSANRQFWNGLVKAERVVSVKTE
jgi:hypothetical protein